MSRKNGGYGIPQEQVFLRIRCREANLTYEQAAAVCGISAHSLSRWYRNHGMSNAVGQNGICYKNSIPHKIGEEIIDLRCKGLSLREIGKLSGYCHHTVKQYLNKRGYR